MISLLVASWEHRHEALGVVSAPEHISRLVAGRWGDSPPTDLVTWRFVDGGVAQGAAGREEVLDEEEVPLAVRRMLRTWRAAHGVTALQRINRFSVDTAARRVSYRSSNSDPRAAPTAGGLAEPDRRPDP